MGWAGGAPGRMHASYRGAAGLQESKAQLRPLAAQRPAKIVPAFEQSREPLLGLGCGCRRLPAPPTSLVLLLVPLHGLLPGLLPEPQCPWGLIEPPEVAAPAQPAPPLTPSLLLQSSKRPGPGTPLVWPNIPVAQRGGARCTTTTKCGGGVRYAGGVGKLEGPVGA